MKDSDIYRNAARRLEERGGGFPCIEVGSCTPHGHGNDWHSNDTPAGRFILMMAPGNHADTRAASDAYLMKAWKENDAHNDHDVLALCFMAAISESLHR